MGIMGAARTALVAVLLGLLIGAGAAQAAPRVAEYVVDARNGAVLHERDAHVKLHPASLTKMMTLYLVFEAVESGKLDLDQRVVVSAAAAAQPPSKVGFKVGQQVRIRDLIRAAAVRSANDSAVVLAEAVSGSEARFAELMTRRARDLGMSNTTFRNASGLTASGHLSTAHDMTVLGLRLFQDYPEYYNLFGRTATPAFGKTITNTNRLLSSYRGADGIKTGYTRAAGFNLVSSAERDGVRVIATLFGGRSGASRNARVAELMDLGFQRASDAPRRGAPAEALVARAAPAATPAVTAAVAPAPRPGSADNSPSLLAQGVRAVGAALGPSAAQAAEPRAFASVTPFYDTAPAPKPGATLRQTVLPTPRGGWAAAGGAAPAGRTATSWTVGLGAFDNPEKAVAELASTALGAMPELAAAGREVAVTQRDGGSLYQARLTGLSPEVAEAACVRIRHAGGACQVAPATN
jgi:D-alanyl-D-alanine carboxypeptidase